jgi:hypothetical protein
VERITIDFGETDARPAIGATPTLIEYLGGPRDLERESIYGHEPPSVMIVSDRHGPAGSYRRSVRCADDNILRYVWQEG